jgi:acetolactate decarboxylase
MKNLLTVFIPCSLLGLFYHGCTPPNRDAGPWDGKVEVHGALRAMMHEGQTGTTVTLEGMLPDPELYALGALTDLAGEVTIIGGTAYLAYPEEGDRVRIRTVTQSDAAATLLVSTRVAAWRTVPIETTVSFGEIADEVARLAAAAGLETDGRIPFLVEGEFEDLQLHVVDGSRIGAGGAPHDDHRGTAVKDTMARATGTLIGFFSPKDEGVFTHMGSHVHLHCVVDDPVRSGHVDDIKIPPGSMVKFPLRR